MNAFFLQEKGGKEGGGVFSLLQTKDPLCSETLYTYQKLETHSLCKLDSCNCEQDNITYHSFLRPQRKGEKPSILLFCEGLIPHDGFLFFFAGSSNISDKRAAVSRQFCGPLSNTFPRWRRAGGTACRQRFALSILLAYSHHPPNLSGVPGGMLCPFLDLLIHPLQPGMLSARTSSALIILLKWFPKQSNLVYSFRHFHF